jgi:arylesterase/paraoxonase
MTTTKKVLIMILIGIVYFVFDTLIQAGFFKSTTNYFKGKEINVISNLYGTEDLDWDRANNLLYMSSTNRWKYNSGDFDSQDGIYLLRTDIPNFSPQKMETDFKEEFHPHGISWFSVDTVSYLYVINNQISKNTVELFKIESNFLRHINSYYGKLMSSPNDVVGDEIDKFYVTNDHGNTSEKGKIIEDYLRMPYSYVLYYDGSKFSKAHEGLVYANGIQMSNDGTKLFVSHTIGHEIFVLERKKSNGMLIHKKTIAIDSGLDNIDVDENDVIWVAGHPKLFGFIAHAKDSTQISPSQFFKIEDKEGKYEVTKVYENDGSQISAASVVVVKGDNAFVGSVFSDKVLKLEIH